MLLAIAEALNKEGNRIKDMWEQRSLDGAFVENKDLFVNCG